MYAAGKAIDDVTPHIALPTKSISGLMANATTSHPIVSGIHAEIIVKRRPMVTQSGQDRKADTTDINGTIQPVTEITKCF